MLHGDQFPSFYAVISKTEGVVDRAEETEGLVQQSFGRVEDIQRVDFLTAKRQSMRIANEASHSRSPSPNS